MLVTLLFFLPAAAEVRMASGKSPSPELLKAEEQHAAVGARAATAANHTPKTGWGDKDQP